MSNTEFSLEITESHIIRGVRLKAGLCPVALCINEVLNPEYVCETTQTTFCIFKKEDAGSAISKAIHQGSHTASTTDFVSAFDLDQIVSPQRIVVSIPTELVKQPMLNIGSGYNRPNYMDDGDVIFSSVAEKAQAYYKQGLLEKGKTYFFGPVSTLFCDHDGEYLRTYRMRDNWNGWHDVAAYRLDTWESVGTTTYPSPHNGIHRTIVSV